MEQDCLIIEVILYVFYTTCLNECTTDAVDGFTKGAMGTIIVDIFLKHAKCKTVEKNGHSLNAGRSTDFLKRQTHTTS